MAKYFELINDNQNIVIDDAFKTPKFLYKADILTGSTARPSGGVMTAMNTWVYQYERHVFRTALTLRGLGFDYDDTPENMQIVSKCLMVFGRSNGGDAYRVTAYVRENTAGEGYELAVAAVSDTPNYPITICLYTTAEMLPSKLGLLVYNANQELVFDALKGYLQHVGILNGGVSVGGSVAATYTITIPEEMNEEHLFVSQRSSLPYYSAYRIHSKGVSYGYTYYRPVITFPMPNTMVVRLVAQRNVSGSSGSVRYNGFFENVIYCPYPKGFYTGDQ